MNITDWNQAYQDNFTPWDKGLPSPPLVEWLASNKLTGRVLVPGCGVGHDVAHLVSRGIDAHGLDIAPAAVARARDHYPQLEMCIRDRPMERRRWQRLLQHCKFRICDRMGQVRLQIGRREVRDAPLGKALDRTTHFIPADLSLIHI